MKIKRLLSMMVAAAIIAGSMPATVFAGRLNYDPEEAEVPEITETEEKETSKHEVKETKPAEKETKPEEKAPEENKETEAPKQEEKETEAPKEAEETKPEAPEAEDKEAAAAPEENEKAEAEAPEDSADSEKVTEKAPEEAVAVRTKKKAASNEFDDKSFSISNGVLTWKAVDGAVRYRLTVSYGGDAYATTNSFDFGKWIDGMIENRTIFKDNSYELYIFACDTDDFEFTGTQVVIKYKSNAEPKTKLPEVTNVNITSAGIVKWDAYNNGTDFAGYYIRVVGPESAALYVEADKTEFNLKSAVNELVKSGFAEQTSYQIQVVALENYSWDPMAESGYLTYNYKSANKMTVKAKKSLKASAKKAKKKNQSFKRSKVFTIKKNNGKLSFAKVSGNAKITISKSSGKITVKKKIKKGTYKVKFAVKAAGDSTHVSSTKVVTIKIKVK